MGELATRLVAIACGGAAGALARYAVGQALAGVGDGRFSHGTLAVNVVGCFVLGLLMQEAWIAGDASPGAWHAGLTVGLLGGLTTFSTFGYETIRHLESGEPVHALANVALNVLLGLAAAAAGLAASRAWWPVE